MNISSPLVSCLCITENRVAYLQRAINCFLNQSYDNKELVILYNIMDKATSDFISQFHDASIKPYPIEDRNNLTLGELRNISIEKSSGEFFCQWDDDDWYHSERLRQQIDAALNCNKSGSVLMHLIFFDEVKREAYFSFARPWENSILCKKSLYQKGITYPQLNQEEDTAFVSALISQNKLSPVISYPTYIYTYHGQNTWNQSHFNQLFMHSQKLSSRSARLIKEIVNGKCSHLEGSAILRRGELLEELDFFFHLWK